MPDSFPEAFRRYEDWLEDSGLKMPETYDALLEDVKVWGQRRFRGTRLQQEALKVEARRLHIRGIPDDVAEEVRTLDYYDYQEQQEERQETKERWEREGRRIDEAKDPRDLRR